MIIIIIWRKSLKSIICVYLVQQAPAAPSTDVWLQMWLSSLLTTSAWEIPLTARSVRTPLSASAWHLMLQDHPNRPLAQFLMEGICQGFHIGFTKPPEFLKSARSNLEGARQRPQVVDNYLLSEVSIGQVVGPFLPRAVPHVHISRFGVIPKSQPGKWRLIVDLSHPKGHSVNDSISKSLCSLKYVTIDEAIKGIVQHGQETLLAKIDIKNDFRLLLVYIKLIEPLNLHRPIYQRLQVLINKAL